MKQIIELVIYVVIIAVLLVYSYKWEDAKASCVLGYKHVVINPTKLEKLGIEKLCELDADDKLRSLFIGGS